MVTRCDLHGELNSTSGLTLDGQIFKLKAEGSLQRPLLWVVVLEVECEGLLSVIQLEESS